MPQPKVTIVETGIANTASVAAAFNRLDAEVVFTADLPAVERASMLVLPGVGAFGAGMTCLQHNDLARAIHARCALARPTLAICLGLQLLCRSSEESPGIQGLAIIDAHVQAFPKTVLQPQFGWNRVDPEPTCTLLRPGYAYFANSYRIATPPDGWRHAIADHGGPFVAALERGPILACQFHPELSGNWGSQLLRRWLDNSRETATC